MAALASYGWPGNVRELRNVVERAVYRWDTPETADQRDPVRPVRLALVARRALGAVAALRRRAPAPSTTSRRSCSRRPLPRRSRPTTSAPRCMPMSARSSSRRLKANRFNQRATAAALDLSYDQLRHALKRHKLMDSEPA